MKTKSKEEIVDTEIKSRQTGRQSGKGKDGQPEIKENKRFWNSIKVRLNCTGLQSWKSPSRQKTTTKETKAFTKIPYLNPITHCIQFKTCILTDGRTTFHGLPVLVLPHWGLFIQFPSNPNGNDTAMFSCKPKTLIDQIKRCNHR